LRTLVLSPRIILMDEPFGALDPTTRLNMQALLVDLWREAGDRVLRHAFDRGSGVSRRSRLHFLVRTRHDPPRDGSPKPHRPPR
jgi:NitT/TauT family transport system ATP-binding protein